MEYFRYIIKFFYRIRWWIIIFPFFIGIIAFIFTRDNEKTYDVKTTIYTGILTGYNVDESDNRNANVHLSNLMNIITTERTLRNVSLKLLTKCLIYGNENENNSYITSEHYKQLMSIIPRELRPLINKNDEDKTYKNLLNYERPSEDNFIYQILNYNHPYFSVPILSEKIKVGQLGNSDMIEVSYSANDPGVTYNTLDILNKEFVEQYRLLRYSETNNVILFFKNELARLGSQLKTAEDSLINYNIQHRIINYGEQTKQVTMMDAYQQMTDNDLFVSNATSNSLIKFYEGKLGKIGNKIKSNNDFLTNINDLARLNANSFSDEDFSYIKNNNKIKNVETKIRNLAKDITDKSNSANNISYSTIADQWLDQVVLNEKTKAHMNAQNSMRKKLDKDIIYYAPIGATITRKERNISFVESNYMSIMSALNQAILRQKNLEMTAATLKVMNPPLFPLQSSSKGGKIIVLSFILGSFLFIIGYFLIIEILDRTLRDKIRAENLIGAKIIGAFPQKSKLRYRRYNKTIEDMATKQLSTILLPYINGKDKKIINILSIESKDGKSYISKSLVNYWTSININVKKITHDEDFISENNTYAEAQSVKDLCDTKIDNEVIVAEYPPLNYNPFPSTLLNEACVNLLVIRADRAWKETDKAIYNNLLNIKKETTILIYLTQADRNCVEEFTGQLPPYTSLKNLEYKISQLALTSTNVRNDKNK